MSHNYMILGGNGPFGVNAAQYLLEQSDVGRVVCVGRNPEKSAPFTLDVGRGNPRYSYQQIHLVFEQDRLFELFEAEQPNVVINFAALAHGASWKKSWRFYDTNITALAKMTEYLVGKPYLKRWIQIGSSEIYGAAARALPEDAELRPTSPYSVSKAAGDLHLVSFFNVLKFPMNILRPSNAYAPGQQLYRVLPRAIVCGLTGRKLPLQGGGQAKKSYIHARDLSRAIHLTANSAPLGKTYNVGPKDPISIRDLVAKVAEQMKMPFEQLCEAAPDRPGEDALYWLDSSAIKRDLGWEPKVGLEEGIQDMIAWGKKYLAQLRDESAEYVLRA